MKWRDSPRLAVQRAQRVHEIAAWQRPFNRGEGQADIRVALGGVIAVRVIRASIERRGSGMFVDETIH